MKRRSPHLFAAATLALIVMPLGNHANAYQQSSWCVAAQPVDCGRWFYSVANKTASGEWDSGTTTARLNSWAYCSRLNGGINGPYNGPTRAVNGGTSTFDCDSNGTYNRGLTNNGGSVTAI